ncbi:MAG TPA: outer membrane beta-barrel protein [Lacibacter sp.]|nr:outer membrane beta-barrel protein [Lacibacter sp.]
MKTKSIYATLFILVALTTYAAAQQRRWHIGVQLNPGMYELYNKHDWNEDSILLYAVTGKVNSISVGATATLIINKHWGVSTALFYQKSDQQYFAKRASYDPDPNTFLNISDDFYRLRTPVQIQFSTNNEAKHQLIIDIGAQLSFVLKYKEHWTQRQTNFHGEYIIENRYLTGIAPTPTPRKRHLKNGMYKWISVGASAKIAYRAKIYNDWFLELGINGFHDFTNAENRNSISLVNNGPVWSSTSKRYGLGGPIENRPKTYHRMLGAFVNISIPVSINQ